MTLPKLILIKETFYTVNTFGTFKISSAYLEITIWIDRPVFEINLFKEAWKKKINVCSENV